LTVLGFALLLLAPLLSGQSNAVLAAAAGSVLALGISSLVTLLVGNDNEDILDLLFTKNLMISDSSDITSYIGEWFVYLLSKSGGESFWTFGSFKLGRGSYSGTLEAAYSIISPEGARTGYNVSWALRGDSVIVIDSAESGKEPAVVSVYPYMGHIVPSVFAGLAFLETWDLDYSISPSLLSRVPLCEVNQEDRKLDQQAEQKLDKLWLDGMKGRMGENIILRLRRRI